MNMKYSALALAVAASLFTGNVLAGTGTANFTVKLNVTGTCTFAGGGDLDFGTKTAAEVEAGNLGTGEGKVNVKCTKNLPYSVAMGAGSNAQGNVRRMKNSDNDYVKYELYKDNGTGSSWNTALSAISGQSGNTANTVGGQDHSVYGKLLASTNTAVAAGAYTDAVVATLTF